MNKVIQSSGKRKEAIARATIRPGKGSVRINSVSIKNYQPKYAQMRISEPLVLAEGVANDVDIEVSVKGGGVASQADAARLAIARALVAFNDKLKSTFLSYDRQLLVADVRFKEQRKPNSHGKARAKVQKSYR